jgi:hypothetical protein
VTGRGFEKIRPTRGQTRFTPQVFPDLFRVKKWPRDLGRFCALQKTAQRKKSPTSLKFAQSGHPVLFQSSKLTFT